MCDNNNVCVAVLVDSLEIRPLMNDVEVLMIVRAKVPLTCFAIVEWHPIDRVMRQFGLRKIISDDPPNLDQLHDIERENKYFLASLSLSLDCQMKSLE